MSKNHILYRIFLWIFLFTLIGSIIFAFLQGRNPEFLDANIFYATALGFISSATIMTFYAYYRPPTRPLDITAEPKEKLPHGDFSGVLTLDNGISITYEHAWQEPVISTINSEGFATTLPEGVKFIWTVVKFGNARVVIEPKSGQITIPISKEIKIAVKIGNKTKASIGY